MSLKEFAKNNIVVFDGAMGTSIQKINIDENKWQGKNGETKVFFLPAAARLAISTASLFISTTLSSKPYSDKTEAIAPNVFVTVCSRQNVLMWIYII